METTGTLTVSIGELWSHMSLVPPLTSLAVSPISTSTMTSSDSIVLDNMGLDGVKLSVRRSFYFAWITSLFGAAATYYLLARFFPQKSYVMNKNEKWGEWTQDKVEAWGAARRRGDRDGAEMFDETLQKESEVVMDADEKDVDLEGEGDDKHKRDRVGVAVLEA